MTPYPSIDLEDYHPDEEAINLLSEEIARRFLVLPLFRLHDRLYVATAQPDDLLIQDYLRQLTGLAIEPVFAAPPDLEAAVNRHFLTREKSARTMGAIAEQQAPVEEEGKVHLHVEDLDAPAIKLVNHLFSQAINLGASDVHIECFPEHVQLRYRVDGVLHEFPSPPQNLHRALVSRIKIIANLDVAERRLPQDGRASFRQGERAYDLRVSIIPNLHGECVVVRILDTHGMRMEIDHLGFSPETLSRYTRLVQRPHGIVLVTGPTGSGKTTTIYSTLKLIQTPKRKIVTLEDPVEYQLPGITQFQVRPDIGFDFARGLRSILRHDPDIILLGEIRDLETAEIAIRASLTGHLVFSTLHTNDAPSAITRLLDMGIPPFLVFASLLGVLAQRLLRRLCPGCKKASDPAPAQRSYLGHDVAPEGTVLYEAAGCAACGQIGYRGRIGVFELLEITPAIRRLSSNQVTHEELRELAREKGFVTLRESAIEKLLLGLTSLEEVSGLTTME